MTPRLAAALEQARIFCDVDYDSQEVRALAVAFDYFAERQEAIVLADARSALRALAEEWTRLGNVVGLSAMVHALEQADRRLASLTAPESHGERRGR